jgi:hypothetical protein
MAAEVDAVAGVGDVCGLCHVYSSNHKGNCGQNTAIDWRAYVAKLWRNHGKG